MKREKTDNVPNPPFNKTISLATIVTALATILGSETAEAQETLRDMIAHPENYQDVIEWIFNEHQDKDSLIFSHGSVFIRENGHDKRFILIGKNGNYIPLSWDQDGSINIPYPASYGYSTERANFEYILQDLLNSARGKTQEEKQTTLEKETAKILDQVDRINQKYHTSLKLLLDSTYDSFDPHGILGHSIYPSPKRFQRSKPSFPLPRDNTSKK